MTLRTRIKAATLAIIIGAVAATTGPAGSAAAAGHNSGTKNSPYACYGQDGMQANICLYWDASMVGAWSSYGYDPASPHGVKDLAGKRFTWGSGAGLNTLVKNNAGAMACGPTKCYSYYNENWTGNYDYAAAYKAGTLYYTWNDEASVKWDS